MRYFMTHLKHLPKSCKFTTHLIWDSYTTLFGVQSYICDAIGAQKFSLRAKFCCDCSVHAASGH